MVTVNTGTTELDFGVEVISRQSPSLFLLHTSKYRPSHDRWNPKLKNNLFQFLWSGRKDVDVGEFCSSIGSDMVHHMELPTKVLRRSSRYAHVIEI